MMFAVVSNTRPERRNDSNVPPEELYELLCACWHCDEMKRPAMDEVCKALRVLRVQAQAVSSLGSQGWKSGEVEVEGG